MMRADTLHVLLADLERGAPCGELKRRSRQLPDAERAVFLTVFIDRLLGDADTASANAKLGGSAAVLRVLAIDEFSERNAAALRLSNSDQRALQILGLRQWLRWAGIEGVTNVARFLFPGAVRTQEGTR